MKIPVGRTIEGAFGFVFRNFLSVFGVIWFPYLVATAIIVGATLWLVPDWRTVFDHVGNDPTTIVGPMMRLARIFTVAWPVLLVVGAMVEVGLLRQALGLHKGQTLVYFSLGAPVWRMVGALILVFFISLAIVLATALAAGLIIGLASTFVPSPGRWWIDGIVGAVAVIWAIYAVIRLRFFLPAVVVAEGEIGIGRAWHLAGGNVLRIIAISLVIGISVSIVFGIISALFTPAIPFPMFAQHGDPQMIWRWYSVVLHSVGPVLVAIRLVQIAFMAALGAGAVASAYRSLVPPAAAEGMHS